jgi:hypothetical protein
MMNDPILDTLPTVPAYSHAAAMGKITIGTNPQPGGATDRW